ncbi:MAG TPA: hypothetical protein PKE45_14930 [Caldilineaceae bacterium]|nr:hypothetical protein [Caldilineaceae bacterium]
MTTPAPVRNPLVLIRAMPKAERAVPGDLNERWLAKPDRFLSTQGIA